MRDEQVGDVVLYTVGGEPRGHGKLLAHEGDTHAKIRLVTGPESGRTIEEVPWGVITPLMRREDYGQGYVIEVRVRILDGHFSDRGFIRSPNPAGTGLPMETSFSSTGKYSDPEAALEAGLAFAKKVIDGTLGEG